jgi:hypothetical protein
MSSGRFITVLAATLLLASCGGAISSRQVREQIATLGGAALSPDEVQVERIISQTASRAIAEFTVQMAGEYERNADGDWKLVSIRIGENDWIGLDQLEQALAGMDVEDTRSNLRMLAGGVEAYRRARGALPVASGADSLPDLLHPLFVPTLARQDAWGSDFVYEPSDTAFRLRSAGPDRQFGTPDDIEVSGSVDP